MKVSKKIINLETESAFSILAKANELSAQGKDIINLGIGQPDFTPPINIINKAIIILHLKVNLLWIHSFTLDEYVALDYKFFFHFASL